MLSQEALELIRQREFISIASCDFSGHPNAASKFVLRAEDDSIFLVDYTIGKTVQNVRMNPRVSLSLTDTKTLTGYQLNGTVEIIEKGQAFEQIKAEMIARQVDLTAKHILEEVRGLKRHEEFELGITERFLILKVNLKEVVRLSTQGEIEREKIDRRKGLR